MSWVERHIALVFFGGLALLAVLGYGVLRMLTREDFAMTGSVVGQGPEAFEIKPGECDVVDKRSVESRTKSGRIHVFRRGGEVILGLEPANRPPLELHRGVCSVFDAALVETNSLYNKSRVWRGHVRASCGAIQVSLAFGKCV